MDTRNILIADSNEDFLLAMTRVLQPGFHVRCCQDGSQALSLLHREHWDLVILDLMLPQLDGITLLETAAAEGIRPSVLATTLLINDYILRSVQRLNIRYLVRKPCDAAAVAARAEDLLGQFPSPDRTLEDRRIVSRLLLSLGLATKYDGYDYLLECIPGMAKNPTQAFTKELYPTVGKRFNSSGKQVERSIRNALDAAWKNHDERLWQQYFPPSPKRPTSAQFITRMAEVLRQSRE